MTGTASLPALIEDALAARAAAGDASGAAAVRAGFAEAAARPVTLRANTLVATATEVADALSRAGIPFERVPWYEDAFMLGDGVRERAVWELPLYQAGGVYLQSLSSMLPPLVLAPRPGADVLDMCAAPGGKTSQMAALAGGRAHLTACELHAPRAEKLAYNLEKLGARNVNIMRMDARRLDEFFSFDQILLDAPCTGTGTLRAGDDRAARRMTPALLAKVTRSQHALLDRALTVLKPGGTLVYSTCSILPQENEEQVRAALKRHRDCELIPLAARGAEEEGAAPLPPTAQTVVDTVEEGAIPTIPATLPGTLAVAPARRFEGFYLAALHKVR